MMSSWRSFGSAPPDYLRALPACAPQSCARPAWKFIANCRVRTRSARTHVGAGWIRPVRAVTRAMPAGCVTALVGDHRPACETPAGCLRPGPLVIGELSVPPSELWPGLFFV